MNRDLTAELLAWAGNEGGFDLVGVADASPLPGAARLARWIAAGAHGSMEYLARTADRRGDPSALLPGARSVVVGAISYLDDGEADAPPRSPAVRVARYACRRDYHTVLRRRLIRLGHTLAEHAPGAAWRVTVDTSPLLEKELAHRAGLGWIGRNTLLINPERGSWLLLGTLVTDVTLRPSAPQPDRCGECRLCAAACPTSAIGADRWLDARRCISYLTLENSGDIPGDLQSGVGPWLAGCDECQTVCPWNRLARPPVHPSLPRRPELSRLEPSKLSALSQDEWRTLASGTPLTRLTFGRFRRNLAVVEANHDRTPAPGLPPPDS